MSHDYRDVLLKAASRVEQEGMWCQGSLRNGTASCALGHLCDTATELDLFVGDSIDALAAHLKADVAPWNDTPGRTAFEVAEAMRKAAE